MRRVLAVIAIAFALAGISVAHSPAINAVKGNVVMSPEDDGNWT
jgi:hypothetical protein